MTYKSFLSFLAFVYLKWSRNLNDIVITPENYLLFLIQLNKNHLQIIRKFRLLDNLMLILPFQTELPLLK